MNYVIGNNATAPELVQQIICDQLQVTWNEVRHKGRKKEHVAARQCYVHVMKIYTDLTDDEIASHVNRERSTVTQTRIRVDWFIYIKDDYLMERLKPIVEQLNALSNDDKTI